MTPEDLRADIPACRHGIHLNTGGSGPAPRQVIDATTGEIERHETEAVFAEGAYPAAYGAYDAAREAVAELLGAPPGDVALAGSTGDGISRVAAALDWEAGDVVVRTDLEHSAGVLPWWNLEREGVEVRVLETDRGRLSMDAVREAVADARLLCLNSIAWNYGTRLPVSEVVDVAHDAGTLVLVDAVQSVGQVPVDVTDWGADFVAAAGHKWLLGPWGAGFMYAREEVAADLVPAQVSYRSVVDSTAADPELHPGARRFEVGTASPGPYRGLVAATETLDAVGFDAVTDRIERLTDRLKTGLGDRLLSPEGYESGLVTFAAEDPPALVDRLAERGIAIRWLPDPHAARASIHAFNTADEVDTLLEAL